MLTFNSQVQVGERLRSFSGDAIKNETMFFSASYDYAMQHGGEITRHVLKSLPEEWRGGVFDSRVHMLMPGWWPAIPGYHHDDVPRSRSDNQPNYADPEYRSRHVLFSANAAISPTTFALGRCALPDIEPGEKYYEKWHPLVEQLVKHGYLEEFEAPADTLVYFDWQSLHKAVPARKNGWRFFIRGSLDTTRAVRNEVRRQVQVYLEDPMAGW